MTRAHIIIIALIATAGLIVGISYHTALISGVQSIDQTLKNPPVQPHPVQLINIQECQYIITEQPFTITHRGDCTNATRHVFALVYPLWPNLWNTNASQGTNVYDAAGKPVGFIPKNKL